MLKGTAISKPKISHFDFLYALNGRPDVFLGAFLAMRMARYRNKIAWDRDMLEWVARVWNEAAIAAAGQTRVRDACLHEAKRYETLAADLYKGEVERQEEGVVIFDREDDWPHPQVVREAIKALEHAEITRA